MDPKKAFITGSAGFVGFHLALYLLNAGWRVHGYDSMSNYYDVSLKQARLSELKRFSLFTFSEAELEDYATLQEVINDFLPTIVVHLAAQAGVRYSLENPRAYIDSNLIGTFNVLELVKDIDVSHLLMASTSSVYGDNDDMPFTEQHATDSPLTLYAATKKANEVMAHSYAHLWGTPITMFRFFTVYGPWGRPDLALFKFVEAILDDRPIDIYNFGEMYRDFTYVDDLVYSIFLLLDQPPSAGDSTFPNVPYRCVNVGNSTKVKLLDFIDLIEETLGKKASRNYMPMQLGDVPATWADTSLLNSIIDFSPKTDVKTGVRNFVDWFREFYGK